MEQRSIGTILGRGGLIAVLALTLDLTLPAAANEGGSGEAPVSIDPAGRAPSSVFQRRNAREPVVRAAPRQRNTTVRTRPRARVIRESAPSGQPADGETRMLADEVVVRYQLSARQSNMDALVARLGLRHVEGRTFALAGVTVHRYAITAGSPSGIGAVIAALEANSTVVTAQPNYLYFLLQGAAGAVASPQYALDALDIRAAHAQTKGAGVSIAVIDSQIDGQHVEFAGSPIDQHDTTGVDGAPHAHGTSIAGVIAARGTLLGIAPEVNLVGVRAFVEDDSQPSAYSTSWRIAAALEQAAQTGARVVNMSFAGPRDPLIERSVAGGAKAGMVLVAAAGNDGPVAPPQFPAAYEQVIGVTAVDSGSLVFEHANVGDYVALSAPGVDIIAPAPDNGYQITSGTSLAAAHVSGIAALLVARDPSLRPDEVAEVLVGAAADLGQPGRDTVFGAGLPDALTAIDALVARKK